MPTSPVLAWLEVRGFRAFGTELRHMDLDAPLVVVHGHNSQGKSSLAEALEFLITGRNSRRDLLGGAKAEYNESLRNAHLPPGEQAVWVAAGVRDSAGTVHEVRRELVCDFGAGTECESKLLVDGVEEQDLFAFGLGAAPDSAVSAPVLLQHTLRHVLSTEPKQRVTYFKALLSLTDLDLLRERVVEARRRLESQPATAAARMLTALSVTPYCRVAAMLNLVSIPSEEDATANVERELLAAGELALGERPADLLALAGTLRAAVERQRDAVFPLSPFAGTTEVPPDPATVDLQAYRHALGEADRTAAALAPVFAAVLAVPAIAQASGPADCPVCATPEALTAERLEVLRGELRRNHAVDEASRAAVAQIHGAAEGSGRLVQQVNSAVPAAGMWTAEQAIRARERMSDLGLDEALLTRAVRSAAHVRTAASGVTAEAQVLRAARNGDLRRITEHVDVDEAASTAATRKVGDALEGLRRARRESDEAADALRAVVTPAVSARTASAGLQELLAAVEHARELVAEVRRSALRATTCRRLAAAENALATASATVLDTRFERMSDSITRWWLTIRPEELVGFAGVQRRARGATFVNLMASLQTDATAQPVERPALGVFSDSQLNALGLATFLARSELLASPLVVLDDPIPGSDGDHRLTFAQNTLQGLLDAGTQVILTTFDDKLALLAAAQHVGVERRTFELTLTDHLAGTDPAPTSDPFDQLMLEAEDNLHAPTPKGRRAACNAYRSAAERLAKQIIATARTASGTTTIVTDVEREAKVLGDLVVLAKGFALANDEKGNWSTFATVLNPGSHDDDVPSTAELKQVRGNLRRIAKNHRAHWPGGLML